MLSPIKKIIFPKFKINKKQKISENNDIKASYKTNPINNSNINFMSHYTPPLNFIGFSQTLEDNYFQLPQIELIDGSKYQLTPDKTQIECARGIYDGKTVLYIVPTGTGKTATAHYAITKNLNEGKKTIYTVPTRALANDKYREFKKIYGSENVGILTGENKTNTNAPIQIMIAEIFNNQIPHLNPSNVGTVVIDEMHHIGSFDRGNVWENSIINASKKDIQILGLSATVGNSRKLGEWFQKINLGKEVKIIEIKPYNRYVPLVWHIHELNNTKEGAKDKSGKFTNIENYEVDLQQIDPKNLTDKQKRAFRIIYKVQNDYRGNVFVKDGEYEEIAQNMLSKFSSKMEYTLFDIEDFKKFLKEFYREISDEKIEEIAQLLADRETKEINKVKPRHHEDDIPSLVEDLKRENMLPAIIFKLSKSKTKDVVKALKEAKVDLTTDEEKRKIEEILNRYEEEGIYLGNNFDKKAILSGYAFHHSGILPQYRKLIEDLFSEKLLKVVSATSTLNVGVNMPAKTVVLTDVVYKKFNPLTNELELKPISASDFHQMAGRAGRRGVDNLGHVVLYNLKTNNENLNVETNIDNKELDENRKINELDLAYELLESSSNEIKSSFSPEWTMLAQYYSENQDDEGLKDLIDKSLRMYLSDEPEKEEQRLLKNFIKYKTVLEKLGFIETDSKGKIILNPKGAMLTKCQCTNPLLLASLIYDEQLKNVDMYDLCQIVGYIASSDISEDDEGLDKVINDRFDLLAPSPSKKEKFDKYNKIKQKIEKYEGTILRRENESRISKDKIVKSDSFGGFVACIWALLNDNDKDSIKNFRAITGSLDKAINEQEMKKLGEASILYNRKALEGNVHKILSQSVTILKQIDKICDFALSNSDIYPNRDYYSNLKETAQLALLLMKQNPIYDEGAL